MNFAAVLFALALAGQAVGPDARSSACAPTASLRDGLQARFGSSRVLSFADLYEDERALFRTDHPGACPGLVSGRFFGPRERPAFALVLLDVGPKKEVRLVVARPAMSTWTFHEVEALAQGSTPVILKSLPGKGPESVETNAARAGQDVVVISGYEAWSRGYVWNGRAFQLLPTRE